MNNDNNNPNPEPSQTNVGNTVRATWQFSLDDIRANIANYPEAARNALVSLFLWCIDPRHPMHKPDAAKRVGASDNLLYKLYTGKYRDAENHQLNPSPDLVRSILNFLDIERERFEAGETLFVPTPTSKKIANAVELARESNTIVQLWGPSHIGKTWALEHHAAANNHGRTVYCRLEAASGLGGMVRCIASSLGISDKNNTANLIARIKNALTRDTVLILDECHLLAYTYRAGSFFNCIEVIREIHDTTRAGLVLCFTNIKVLRDHAQRELEQVNRRGVHKVPLPVMPTVPDLTAILQHAGLDFPDAGLEVTVGKATDKPREVLRHLARTEGLKAITERLRYGRKLAAKARAEKLTWSHVMDAHFRITRQAEQEGEWR